MERETPTVVWGGKGDHHKSGVEIPLGVQQKRGKNDGEGKVPGGQILGECGKRRFK